MKTLITILTVFFLTCIGQATEIPLPEDCIKSVYGDYSYQGYIDPQVITNSWILLEDKCMPIGPGTLEMYFRNPESPCEIPVAVFLVYQGAFIGFAYLYDGGAYLYLFDLDSKCYIGKRLEGEVEPRFKEKLGGALGLRSL